MLMALHYIFFFIIFPPFSLPPTLLCCRKCSCKSSLAFSGSVCTLLCTPTLHIHFPASNRHYFHSRRRFWVRRFDLHNESEILSLSSFSYPLLFQSCREEEGKSCRWSGGFPHTTAMTLVASLSNQVPIQYRHSLVYKNTPADGWLTVSFNVYRTFD